MRLTVKEIDLIKESVCSIFGDAIVYLFGSRVDDSKRGGDIDLYIVPKREENSFEKKVRLKTLLEDRLYKPVDIVVARDPNRLIEQEALKGIVL